MSKSRILALEDDTVTDPVVNGAAEGAAPTEDDAAAAAATEAEIAEIPAEELSEERIDASVAEAPVEDAETQAAADTVAEAESIGDTVDSMIETTEAAVTPTPPAEEGGEETPAEGLPQEAAEVIEAAMEHFYVRLGVNRSRAMPAMESFEQDRLAASKATLAHLKDLRARLDKNVAVAQEGLLDRIGNAFARTFTSQKKMFAAVSKLDASQLKEPTSLGSPAWGRVFGLAKKGQVGGAEVAGVMGEVHDNTMAIAKAINTSAEHLEKILAVLGKKLIGSADGAVEEIEQHGEDIMKVMEAAAGGLTHAAKGDKMDVEVISCDKGNFDKIAKMMYDRQGQAALDRAWARFSEAYAAIDTRGDFAQGTKLGTFVALAQLAMADRRAAERVLRKITKGASDQVFDAGINLSAMNTSCVHGAYKYLTASVQGGNK